MQHQIAAIIELLCLVHRQNKSYWIMSSSFSTFAKVATLFFSRYTCPGPPCRKESELLDSEKYKSHLIPSHAVEFMTVVEIGGKLFALQQQHDILIMSNLFHHGSIRCVTLFNRMADYSCMEVRNINKCRQMSRFFLFTYHDISSPAICTYLILNNIRINLQSHKYFLMSF